MNNQYSYQEWDQDLVRDQNLPVKGKLGYFIDSEFVIEDPNDPSRYLVRTQNRFMSLPHKGRVVAPDDLTTKESRNIEVLLGYDVSNEYSILTLEPSQAKANLQHNPDLLTGLRITSITAGAGIIVTFPDAHTAHIAADPVYVPTFRWEPLIYDGDIVTFDGDIIMVYVPI